MLLETHPSLAGWVARDLTVWRDWRLAVLAGMATGPFLYLAFTGALPAIEVPVIESSNEFDTIRADTLLVCGGEVEATTVRLYYPNPALFGGTAYHRRRYASLAGY